ncbi:hypothetical protein [Anaerosinus massiliensis]|uniref:hypothetical protein n=1 Tax=Massilibacillus massiliensis TaxID=1806837 RepID=UPI000DA603AA|nr:hypothetical protein [Massilibacillus massiliensis]
MDTELMKYLDEKFNKIDAKFDKLETKIDAIQQDLKEFRVETHNDIKSLYTIVGELQGNIEEMQYDTSYIAAKTLLKKMPKFPNK